MTKIVFLDIDGTMLSHTTNAVPDSTKLAIQKARKKGIKVFVCSGRNTMEYRDMDQLQDLSFDGYIFMGGALALYQNEVISSHPLDTKDVESIISFCDDHHYPLAVVEENDYYINFINEQVIKAQQAIHTPLQDIGDIHHALHVPVYQMMIYPKEQEYEEILQKMEHTLVTYWNKHGYDLVSKECGKGVALKEVCDHFNIPIEESLAIGDGDNDIDMLKMAGISVAMGNAEESVKKVSQYVTDDIDHDGLYNAFVHFHIL